MSILKSSPPSDSRPRSLKCLRNPVSHLSFQLSTADPALIDSIPRSLAVIVSFQNGDIFENLSIAILPKFLNFLTIESQFPQASSKVGTSGDIFVTPVIHQQKLDLLATTSSDDLFFVVCLSKAERENKIIIYGIPLNESLNDLLLELKPFGAVSAIGKSFLQYGNKIDTESILTTFFPSSLPILFLLLQNIFRFSVDSRAHQLPMSKGRSMQTVHSFN